MLKKYKEHARLHASGYPISYPVCACLASQSVDPLIRAMLLPRFGPYQGKTALLRVRFAVGQRHLPTEILVSKYTYASGLYISIKDHLSV